MNRFRTSARPQNWFTRRRAERLEREISLLERLNASLWRKMVVCAVLSTLGMAAGLFAVALALHVQWGLTVAIPVCLGTAAVLYLVSRYEHGWFWLFTFVVVAVVLIFIFESGDFPDLGNLDFTGAGTKKAKRKMARQLKLKQAIAKRKLRLEQALGKL